MALELVPPGTVATVVTSLEMSAPPPRRPLPPSRFRLERWQAPSLDRYRALFRRVGAPWLWFSRLVMADADLAATLADPRIEVFAVTDTRGVEVGMLELDLREAGTCEIAYLGLVPELTGKGLGGWLMANTLALGWRAGVSRMWVHTCTLDHPAALEFYRRHGFRPFSRAIETFVDPRVAGALPRDCAPTIPLLEDG